MLMGLAVRLKHLIADLVVKIAVDKFHGVVHFFRVLADVFLIADIMTRRVSYSRCQSDLVLEDLRLHRLQL